MKLVELVITPFTNALIISDSIELLTRLGKTAVICQDSPGFIVNRVARPYYLESLKMLEAGYADFETIDDIMEATGFKMGPFRLMDLIGIDINHAVSSSIYESLNKPSRLQPSPTQEEMIKNGKLGKKTGKGFYEYSSSS
jgi:3-hydroxybutyryl-CoA dehydrogenase